MDRYILAIKRDYRRTRTRDDMLESVSGIRDLKIVGGIEGSLVITATSQAVGTLVNRVKSWCHVEKEILYRPSVHS